MEPFALFNLSDEIIVHILSFVESPVVFCKFSQTCQKALQIVRNDIDLSWKELYKSKWIPFPEPKQGAWFHHYQRRTVSDRNWKKCRFSKIVLESYSGHVNELQLLNDTIVAATENGLLLVYSLELLKFPNTQNDVTTMKPAKVIAAHDYPIWAMQFDRSKIVSGDSDGIVKIHNMETGKLECSFHAHDQGVRSLQFNDRYITTSENPSDDDVEYWNFNGRPYRPSTEDKPSKNLKKEETPSDLTERRRQELEKEENSCYTWSVGARDANRLLASASQFVESEKTRVIQFGRDRIGVGTVEGKVVVLIQGKDRKIENTLMIHEQESEITSIQFDERWLVSASKDGTILLFDFAIP